MFCIKCGAKVVEGAKFCQKCGAPVDTSLSAALDMPARLSVAKPDRNPSTMPTTPEVPQSTLADQSGGKKQANVPAANAIHSSSDPLAPTSPADPQVPGPAKKAPAGYPGFTPSPVHPKKKGVRWPWVVCGIGIAVVIIVVLGILGSTPEYSPASSESLESTDSSEPASSQVQEVTLTETYTNEDEGFSFEYPAEWKSVGVSKMEEYYEIDSLTKLPVMLLVNEKEESLVSTMDVFAWEASQDDVDWLLSSDAEFAESFSDVSWIDTSIIDLGGISARELLTIDSDGMYSRSYLYINGSKLYQIGFYCHESYRDDMDPIYDDVINSCTIIVDPINSPAPPSPSDLPSGMAWVEMPHTISDKWPTSITGILQNTSTSTYEMLTIEFNLFDSAGNQIGTAEDYLTNLQAGGTWKFKAVVFSDDVSRYELASVTFH